jgi:hypothetical protein
MAILSLLASLLIGASIAVFLDNWEKMRDQNSSKYGG